jgi:exportin-2 (importin alpha re-exporter)
MLSFHNKGDLTTPYQNMLLPLIQPALWFQQGNIPALTRLLKNYFNIGANWIVSNSQLEPILGIFQKLIASKINDNYGFELVMSIIENVPM